jgi:hypothetical protein
MVWLTLWFLVILKLPALYLAYVVWWAVKDPPTPGSDPTAGLGGGGSGPGPRPPRTRRPIPGRRPGPHGVPVRRPAPAVARLRSKRRV